MYRIVCITFVMQLLISERFKYIIKYVCVEYGTNLSYVIAHEYCIPEMQREFKVNIARHNV